MDFQRLGDYLALPYRLKNAIGFEGQGAGFGRGESIGVREHVSGCCGRGMRSETSKRAMALIMSALMLAVIVVPLVYSGPHDVYAVDTGAHDVTYHYDANDSDGTAITYYGIASAEYNPVYWNSDNGNDNWNAPNNTTTKVGGTLRIEFSNDAGNSFVVPEGMSFLYQGGALQWDYHYSNLIDFDEPVVAYNDENRILTVNFTSTLYHPTGYVTIPFTYEFHKEITTVFAGWTTTPTYFDAEVDNLEYYEPGDILPDSVKDLYAVWYTPNIYCIFDDTINIKGTIEAPIYHSDYRVFGEDYSQYCNLALHPNNPYTEIILVNGTRNADDGLSTGTYRSMNGANSTLVLNEPGWNDYTTHLTGDVIIDNLVIKSGMANSDSNHGANNRTGLFANGYKLIIGTNVTTKAYDNFANYNYGYPQIFGGLDEGDNGDRDGYITNTHVVIFSGTYYNVVAGNYDANIGSTASESYGGTFLVIRGSTVVLDTVVGGNSNSRQSSTIYGDTNIYILGGCLPADSYQEEELKSSGNIPGGITLQESTILTGGSNNGRITGDTNVYLSGTANLWDVQGGGRRGPSVVEGTVNVEVSGQAAIRHVLCGSITDGLNNSPSSNYSGSVKEVNITIKDNAMVASVFGAGYDTYYAPDYASMLNGGSITIDIQGGTIGYVYGGGYRGAIGYSGNLESSTTQRPLDSITINMSGGTVLEDIFGGGRGGVDKVLHDVNGNRTDYATSNSDSTGYAWTCVDTISITISGGTVGGSVYGGGESVESLEGVGSKQGVAKVEADEIIIDISGGTVGGSVYGGGKGVSADTAQQSIAAKTISFEIEKPDTTSDQTIFSIKDDKLTLFDAYADISEPSNDNSHYSGYAQVGTSSHRPTIQIGISGNASVGNSEVSVFGAGNIARTYADGIEIELGDGTSVQPTLKGDVHGGGYGTTEVLSVESDRTIILNNARVEGNIFGGTRNGDDGRLTSTPTTTDRTAEINLIAGIVTQNVYGGGFQGRSMFNVEMRFGTPAVEHVRPESYPNPTLLRVGSIYGGGYFNPNSSTTDDETTVDGRPTLVYGDVDIRIGSLASSGDYQFPGYNNVTDSSGSRIAIYGDVFGDGSFSLIDGESDIIFDGYTQTSSSDSQRIRSVQLADYVRFVNSIVDLQGSSAGGSDDLTELMALNGIVQLEMHGISLLTLYSEMNEIGEYYSYNNQNNESTPSDFGNDCGNTLKLMGGAMAMILGNGNDASISADDEDDRIGKVHGFTVIDNGGDVFYGAFAMAADDTDDDNAGFLVENEDGSYSRAPYITDDTSGIKIWYVSGATSMERMLTFSPDGYEDSTDIIIPRISSSSNLYYTGAYIDYAIQNSMYVVGDSEYAEASNSNQLESINYFKMSLGGSINVESHVFNGIWQTATSDSSVMGSSVELKASLFGENPTMVGLS